MNTQLAPICLFVYNRPWHTRQTLEHLKNNSGAKDSELYIFSDGPKNPQSSEAVNEVRKIINSTEGFKKVEIIERLTNFGLAASIIDGVTTIVNKYGKIIVVEDDLVTSPYFLDYMNRALQIYENSTGVASIHGYCYPIKNKLPQTFFIKGADCWGWATWKRAWEKFESDGQKLADRIIQSGSKREFDFNNSYRYFNMLRRQIKGKNNSWAIRWYASAFLENMYTLYPYPSLVKNIGLDNSGTHSGSYDKLGEALEIKEIEVAIIPVEENKLARKAFEKHFKSLHGINAYLYRISKLITKTIKQ